MARLSASVTQSAANTYTEAQITTGLSGLTTRAYQIRSINFEYSAALEGNDGDQLEWQLTRRTKTAMTQMTDVDCIVKQKDAAVLVGAAGGWYYPLVQQWVPARDTFIVEDPIYLASDANGLAAAVTVYVEIFYDLVTVSELDRLSLIVQSLEQD